MTLQLVAGSKGLEVFPTPALDTVLLCGTVVKLQCIKWLVRLVTNKRSLPPTLKQIGSGLT